uniref:phosphoribosyltransferase-like protein n=1 Tax=Marinobacter shengliensis TaxID=1389223 RepID=UPI0014870C43|nr:hypothetical protein [Marinobacter shengliensis]
MDSEEDQWIAFKSLEYFFFAGVNEYNELYRCAHEHCIIPWLVETNSLNIFDSTLEEKINSLIKNCWFCPVTDSLRINGFLHVTGIKGKSLRPDWLSLKDLGSVDKIEKYIRKHEISRLVLIEDFSGSGYQISRALKFAAENLKIPILLVPLIICDQGDKTLEQLITSPDFS